MFKFDLTFSFKLIRIHHEKASDFMDKVSIIVPVFNMCEHLNRIIISLLKQTFMNLEIILVDRGSSDNSLDICNTWAFLDNRIKVLKTDTSVLESGLKQCTGNIIGICDALNIDDTYMIEMLYGAITNNNSDISIYNSNSSVVKNYEGADERIVQLFATSFGNKLFRSNLFENLNFDDNVLKDVFLKASRISLIV